MPNSEGAPNNELRLIKLECALFEVRTVLVRDQLEQEFSFRFESIVHYVYKGALNLKKLNNRIKPAPNSEYALISEVRLTTREYGTGTPQGIFHKICHSSVY